MNYPAKIFMLYDGRTVLLRSPNASDAELMLTYLKQTSAESDQLLRYSDEWTMTAEDEAAFLENILASERDICISAFAEGKIIGNISINSIGNLRKIKHRASLGMAVISEYQNFGLGSLLLNEALEAIRDSDISMVELGVYSDNEAAIHIYKKEGFYHYGTLPCAYKLDNGTFADEELMFIPIFPAETLKAP